MCGIAGVFGKFSTKEGAAIVQSMCDSIVHRGPDDHGYWASDGAAFGMRRLSIIDLEGGHQPIWTDDGVGIVFNGEIYNYRQLREELAVLGYKFKTDSDTEVLLNAYHCFGLDAIKKLNGMFAFCIIDLRTHQVHFARDRMGIKPLYFASSRENLFIASELREILTAMPKKPRINRKTLNDHLTFGYIPGPESIWDGIQKLDPGHRATYDLKTQNLEIVRYWELNFLSKEIDPNRNYLQEFEGLFLQSVERRIVASDVPVGVFLSGGLDSSSIAAAALEIGHRNFHTFTFSNIDDERSRGELAHARAVAHHIGSHHHEVPVSMNDYADMFEDTANFMDEPHSAISAIPLRLLSRFAREHCKVVLSGEGADETLAGYGLHNLGRLADQRRRLYSRIPRQAFNIMSRIIPGERSKTLRAMGRFGWSGFSRADSAASHMAFAFNENQKSRIWRDYTGLGNSGDLIQSWYDSCPSDEPLDMRLQVHCRTWLSENLLWRADKMSMAESLELRVPFMDHELLEWAATMPMSWRVGDKASGYESKRVLREFVRKRLPASVDNLPKRGITGPSSSWFDPTQNLGKLADKYLLTKGTAFDALFDTSEIATMLQGVRSGKNASPRPIIHLLYLARWLHTNM